MTHLLVATLSPNMMLLARGAIEWVAAESESESESASEGLSLIGRDTHHRGQEPCASPRNSAHPSRQAAGATSRLGYGSGGRGDGGSSVAF
jgi:hypothetical protein